MDAKQSTQASTRRLRWIGGTRRTKQDRKPCMGSHHAGPFVRAAEPTPEVVASWWNAGLPCPFLNNWHCKGCGSTLSAPAGHKPVRAA